MAMPEQEVWKRNVEELCSFDMRTFVDKQMHCPAVTLVLLICQRQNVVGVEDDMALEAAAAHHGWRHCDALDKFG